MPPVKPIGIRSSLFSHSFPTFYACYLLKSIQTPHSTSIYIGSTPSPPRRIRQHNGELAQGARKTRLKRPWVMQMIVHGFPSRLAALQFEWAWQHPHKSRHMRDGKPGIFGNRAYKTLQKNILVVRTMISRPPYNTWPLHVKLFTQEAHHYWEDSMTKAVAFPLPPGFTCALELEGVDGKSGHVGSGRQGPICVDDEEFTSTILAKNTTIVAAGGNMGCTICRKPIFNYAVSPLSTALCPSSECRAVSHLKCLSQYFINQEDRPITVVPRGGHCKSCKQYTLWGDVIRGCYRRMSPSELAIPLLDIDTDDMFVSDDLEVQGKMQSSGGRKKSTSPIRGCTSSKKKSKQKPRSSSTSSKSGIVDLSNLVTSSDSEDIPGPVKRKIGRPRKVLPESLKGSGGKKQPINSESTTSQDNSFNLVASSEVEDNATPMTRKPAQPRKDLASFSVSSPKPLKAFRKTQRSVSPAKPNPSSKGKGNRSSNSLSMSKGETLGSSLGDEAPVKSKRERPNKDVSLLSHGQPGLTSSIISTRPLEMNTKKPKDVTPTSCPELSKEKDETFDLNNLIAIAEREHPSTSLRLSGRPRKTRTPPAGPELSSKGKEQNSVLRSAKIRPRPSQKNMAFLSPGIPSPIPYSQPHKSLKDKDIPALIRTYHGRCQGVGAESNDYSSDGESFDFDGIQDNDENIIRNRQTLWPMHRKFNPLKLGVVTRDLQADA